MATQKVIVSGEWVDINEELSLVDDTRYTLQNHSLMDIKIIESESEPDVEDDGILVTNKETIPIKPEAGLSIWVKSSNDKVSTVIVTKAVC